MPDAVMLSEEAAQLLRHVVVTLEKHIDDEESTLDRIEKLLDGNGQPGLVREHISHREAIAHLETWKAEMQTGRRWLVGLVISVCLAIAAMIVALFQH